VELVSSGKKEKVVRIWLGMKVGNAAEDADIRVKLPSGYKAELHYFGEKTGEGK